MSIYVLTIYIDVKYKYLGVYHVKIDHQHRTNEEKSQQIKDLIDKNTSFHKWRTEEIGGNNSIREFFLKLRKIYRLGPQFTDFHQTSQSLQEKYERIIDEENTARERYKEREKRKRAKKFDFLFQWSAILIALSSLAGMNSFTFEDLIGFGITFIAVAIIAAIIYLIIPKDNDDDDDDDQSDPTSGPRFIEAPKELPDLIIGKAPQKSKITNTQSGNTRTP